MEIFGKVTDIILAREGESKMSGNPYQIQMVVVQGSENVCFEVYGTYEHLEKNMLVKGAEGKFRIKTSVSNYNGKYYQRMEMVDLRRDFTPLAQQPSAPAKTEAQMQYEVIAQAADAAHNAPAQAEQPKGSIDNLPFI